MISTERNAENPSTFFVHEHDGIQGILERVWTLFQYFLAFVVLNLVENLISNIHENHEALG